MPPSDALAAPVRARDPRLPVARNSSMNPGAARTMSPTVEPNVPSSARRASAIASVAERASSSVTCSPFCSFLKVSAVRTAAEMDPDCVPTRDMNGRSEGPTSETASQKSRFLPSLSREMIARSRWPSGRSMSHSRDLTSPPISCAPRTVWVVPDWPLSFRNLTVFSPVGSRSMTNGSLFRCPNVTAVGSSDPGA